MSITFDRVLTFIILAWVFIYTVSYGVWTYKRKNKIGAIAVFILAIITLAMPLLTMYFIG